VIRRRRSLAERVVWAVTMTVAIFLGLQSVVAFVTLHAQEDDLSDTMLQREVQQIVAHILQPGLTPTGTLIDSTRVSAWLTRDGVGGADIPANLRGLAPGLYQLSPADKTLHVAVTDTEEGRLTVVLDATSTEARVDQFGYTLLALWLICVAATVWIARGVAAITVGPLVAATRNIARSAPDEAVPEGQHADEAGLLMETFNRYRDRADEMVEREREFAANLDHEIRTPLTAIRTDAELIGMEAQLAPAQRARLERITAAVDDIIATTESTLSHSAGRVAGEETVDLRDFLTATCDAMADRADAKGLRIVVEIDDGELVHLDRQALLTVVRNLVRNAIEHASPATLRITGDRRSLSFIDDGPGIAAARLERVFDRHQHGHRVDEGAARDSNRRRGLGLAIVRRLCDLQGWRISVRSPVEQGRGTAFLLAFTARPPTSEQARADVDEQRQHGRVEQVREDAVD
jgi:signal transduction histidine kinase